MKIGGRGWLLIVVSVAVAVAVGIGFRALGTPQQARMEELDRIRMRDLQSLSDAILRYPGRRHGPSLPATLDSVELVSRAASSARDPVTKRRYEYERIDGSHFRLCADFGGEVRKEELEEWQEKWAHPAGHACFEFELAPAVDFTPVGRGVRALPPPQPSGGP